MAPAPSILCSGPSITAGPNSANRATRGGSQIGIRTSAIQRLSVKRLLFASETSRMNVSSRCATTIKRREIRTRVQFDGQRPSGYRTCSSDNVLNNRGIQLFFGLFWRFLIADKRVSLSRQVYNPWAVFRTIHAEPDSFRFQLSLCLRLCCVEQMGGNRRFW
jgi:hypothetical protein